MFGIVLIAPVIQLVFLGYAANRDLNEIRTVILDRDKTQSSRSLSEKFTGSGYFTVAGYPDNYDQLGDAIDDGSALIAIVIPSGFESDLKLAKTATVQVIFDGSDGNKASVAAGYVMSIASAYSKDILLKG